MASAWSPCQRCGGGAQSPDFGYPGRTGGRRSVAPCAPHGNAALLPQPPTASIHWGTLVADSRWLILPCPGQPEVRGDRVVAGERRGLPGLRFSPCPARRTGTGGAWCSPPQASLSRKRPGREQRAWVGHRIPRPPGRDGRQFGVPCRPDGGGMGGLPECCPTQTSTFRTRCFNRTIVARTSTTIARSPAVVTCRVAIPDGMCQQSVEGNPPGTRTPP